MSKKTYYVLSIDGLYWSPNGWVKNKKDATHMSWENASEGLERGDRLEEKGTEYIYEIT